jgi:hypothetical protein
LADLIQDGDPSDPGGHRAILLTHVVKKTSPPACFMPGSFLTAPHKKRHPALPDNPALAFGFGVPGSNRKENTSTIQAIAGLSSPQDMPQCNRA